MQYTRNGVVDIGFACRAGDPSSIASCGAKVTLVDSCDAKVTLIDSCGAKVTLVSDRPRSIK